MLEYDERRDPVPGEMYDTYLLRQEKIRNEKLLELAQRVIDLENENKGLRKDYRLMKSKFEHLNNDFDELEGWKG